jgi:hypothetical protein
MIVPASIRYPGSSTWASGTLNVEGRPPSRDRGEISPPVRSKPRTTTFPITGACPSTYPNHDILLNPCRNSGWEASILARTQEAKDQSLPELRKRKINPCRNSGGKHQSLPELQTGSITRSSPSPSSPYSPPLPGPWEKCCPPARSGDR